MKRQPLVLVLSVTLLSSTVLLAPAALAAPFAPAASTEQAESRINGRLAARIDNPRFGSDLAVAVLDAATGRVVFSRRANEPMLPASNMKIITAVNTVAAVGPDHTFRTAVFAGPATGELVLQGGGDPLLSATDLRALANDAAKTLDPALPVTVSTDLNLFPEPSRAPGWPRDYIPSVAASVSPLARFGDYSRDPAANALAIFRQRLKALGFTVQAGTEVDVAADAAPLAQIAENSAADAVRVMLRESENNVAELLFRHVAIAKGQPATWEGARSAAASTLAELGIRTRARERHPAEQHRGSRPVRGHVRPLGHADLGSLRHPRLKVRAIHDEALEVCPRRGPRQDRHALRHDRAERGHHGCRWAAEVLLDPRERPAATIHCARHSAGSRWPGRHGQRLLVTPPPTPVISSSIRLS
ncbi:MAG: D-alanyl-D-alanine carboxypeptidase [Actinobacteria bacterium]|nr:D-alanyl-D-alanine carboxypeptidase [Actinomycetota bacterium]